MKDYHEHGFVAGKDPIDISYNLYSMVVSLVYIIFDLENSFLAVQGIVFVVINNLKDYHEHHFVAGHDPFDISCNLYSMVVGFIILDRVYLIFNLRHLIFGRELVVQDYLK